MCIIRLRQDTNMVLFVIGRGWRGCKREVYMKSNKGRDYGLTAARDGSRAAGRGQWQVEQDGQTYVYRKLPGRPDRRDIRSWIAGAFSRNDGPIRIGGQYPNYYVERA